MPVRNTWVEFSSMPGLTQGGLFAADTMTNKQFFNTLSIAFTVDGGFLAFKAESTMPIEANDEILEPGNYILYPKIPEQIITRSDEHCFPRTLSLSDTSRDNTFKIDVRRRDGGCMITNEMNLEVPDWRAFESAHIFPLALSSLFTQLGFGNIIQDDRGINSPSNGVLLRADIHQHWDGYAIAVNPVDNYRVQSFKPNTRQYHNLVLHPNCRDQNNPHHVLDALLRWHYEQAVLFNMRGAGETSFDFDFPPGTDMMGEIREGPLAAYRMEAELFGRLYGYNDEESVE